MPDRSATILAMDQQWTIPTDAGEITLAPAMPGDAATVLSIFDEAAQWLCDRGIRQWEPGTYPRDYVEDGIAHGWVYLARLADRPVATVRLQWDDPHVWGECPPTAGYLHTLMIRRHIGGKGVGAAIVRWCERQVIAAGRSLLRLDCLATNSGLCAYYERLGFARVRALQSGDYTAALYEKPVASRSC